MSAVDLSKIAKSFAARFNKIFGRWLDEPHDDLEKIVHEYLALLLIVNHIQDDVVRHNVSKLLYIIFTQVAQHGVILANNVSVPDGLYRTYANYVSYHVNRAYGKGDKNEDEPHPFEMPIALVPSPYRPYGSLLPKDICDHLQHINVQLYHDDDFVPNFKEIERERVLNAYRDIVLKRNTVPSAPVKRARSADEQ